MGSRDFLRKAAVTQLFYDVNFFHDWYYDVGFDEKAGNAQKDNYGRGGIEGDALLAPAVTRRVIDKVAQHAVHHEDAAAVARLSERRKTFVDERDDLVAEVGVVAADRRRVEELRSAEGREGVDENDHRVGTQPVDRIRIRLGERSDVEPRADHAEHPLDHVDGRIAP